MEVGSHYLEEGWGTRLMTFTDFIAAMTAATPGEFVGPGCGRDCCNAGNCEARLWPRLVQRRVLPGKREGCAKVLRVERWPVSGWTGVRDVVRAGPDAVVKHLQALHAVAACYAVGLTAMLSLL